VSCCALSPAHKVDDFNHIACLEALLAILGAGDDVSIYLSGNALLGEAQIFD
jgi:hypothetical protein